MPRARVLPSLDPGAMLVFAALARAGGIRGGAALLGVPRSTVSRRLVELETQAGSPLVIRTARRFVLTELGTALLAQSSELEELLRRSAELVLGASGEPSGLLRIAAAPVIGEEVLPEIIDALTRLHPRLTIDVRMSVDYVDLRRGAVDVALRAWPLDDAADLFAVRLGVSTTGCWASPAYAKAHGLPRLPSELTAHECLLVGSAPRPTWTFRVGQRDESVPVAGRIRVDSFRLARDLAARGAGIARMARMFAEPLLQSGELVPVLSRYWPNTPVHAVHAGPNPPTPKVRAFIELARAAIARALAPLPPLISKRPRKRPRESA
jgi:DNA-binding transcriptional LysR family regulator